jgi:hypothetical protein
MLTGCSEYLPGLVELARGLAAPEERRVLIAHVESCADCARALDQQLALSAALGSLVGEALPEMAEIEARVLAEFDRTAERRRRASRWVFAAGLAAAALVGLVAVERRAPAVRPGATPSMEAVRAREAVQSPLPAAVSTSERHVARVSRVRHTVARGAVKAESQPFVPIPYTVPLAPEERATVVHMQVSVAALIAAGFTVATSDPGEVVDADVLVSQDGRARAIRFNSKEEERQ